MRRDMDLVRKLLITLEELSSAHSFHHILPNDENNNDFQFEGYNADQIEYHLFMLREAGFLEGGSTRPMRGIMFRSLTWEGQDFLDSVRDDAIWEKTKKGATVAGGFTVDLLKDLAKGFVRKLIEEKTGVKL